MKNPHGEARLLDREFLTLRSKLVDLAAILDRIDRGGGTAARDPRREAIAASLAVLASAEGDRAERVLTSFSLPYDPSWPRP